ncbi:DJ-1/PfpI family protein [Endozoicomonadaceae bacterium StTr2]
MNKKTLVILYPGCIEFEIKFTLEVISKNSEIYTSTPDGKALKGSTGITYLPDFSYKAALDQHFDCILIPGGDQEDVVENESLKQLIQKADQSGSVIGAVCAGPLLLAIAGILRNRSQTNASIYPSEYAHVWNGSHFVRQQIVVDGHIVTALPEAHIDFGIEVGKLMAAFENDKEAEITRLYYKGHHTRDWSAIGPVD